MKLDRLLSIVIMLLNRERVQARDLADHFDVSIRTIYRDIDAINRAGIPIVTYQGNKGGLGIVDNYKLDRQVLTLEDMVSMLSVLKGVNTAFKDRQIDKAIQKINALVPESKQEYVNSHLDQLVIDVLPWGINSHQKQKMLSLQGAIAERYSVRFSYRDSNGVLSVRTVEPYTLIFKATAWYLFAYCRLRGDFRVFKVSRLSRVEILCDIFTRKKSDYKEYTQFSPDSTRMIQLVIRFSSKIRHEVEEYFDEGSIKITHDGDLIATFELPDNDWVISYLLSLGEHAEVIKPERMRMLLKKKAEKISNMYKPDIQMS